jgi:hypothetical protein
MKAPGEARHDPYFSWAQPWPTRVGLFKAVPRLEKERRGWRLGESSIEGTIFIGKHKRNFLGFKRNGRSIDERRFSANIIRWRDDRQMAICCDHSSVCKHDFYAVS